MEYGHCARCGGKKEKSFSVFQVFLSAFQALCFVRSWFSLWNTDIALGAAEKKYFRLFWLETRSPCFAGLPLRAWRRSRWLCMGICAWRATGPWLAGVLYIVCNAKDCLAHSTECQKVTRAFNKKVIYVYKVFKTVLAPGDMNWGKEIRLSIT